MKILYLACGFDGGFSGISVYMRNTMLRLAEAGHELTIVTTAADRPLLPELEGAVYHVLPAPAEQTACQYALLMADLSVPFFPETI